MSNSPASWSGGGLAEIRTRCWAADPKTVATDPGDFGSVAIGRDSGLYLGRARSTDALSAAAARRLRAAPKAAAAAAWPAWWEPVLPAATTGDTRNALIVIIVAPPSRIVPPPGMKNPGISVRG